MEIHRQNFQSPQFTSRLYPIKPSVVNTKWGKLTLEEVKPLEIRQKGFFEKLAKIFGKNFTSPDWQIFKDPSRKEECKMVTENFAQNLKALFKNDDGNLTLLVARDKQKRIQGACLSYGYDLVPNSKDYTLYIDSICVNRPYRGFSLGKKMLQKTLENSKKSNFTDVFLTGEKHACGFYKKMGFAPLSKQDKNQLKVTNFIALDRFDYPKFVDFLSKPLKPNQERWYNRAAEFIDESWL